VLPFFRWLFKISFSPWTPFLSSNWCEPRVDHPGPFWSMDVDASTPLAASAPLKALLYFLLRPSIGGLTPSYQIVHPRDVDAYEIIHINRLEQPIGFRRTCAPIQDFLVAGGCFPPSSLPQWFRMNFKRPVVLKRPRLLLLRREDPPNLCFLPSTGNRTPHYLVFFLFFFFFFFYKSGLGPVLLSGDVL